MLGSLARKLRILGFDTLYHRHSEDSELLVTTQHTRRILITSDVRLQALAKRRGARCVLVVSSTEKSRLLEVLSKVAIKTVRVGHPESRCSECNGRLAKTDDVVKGLGVPVFKCKECGKEYWKGGHWKKLNFFFASIESGLRSYGDDASS